MTDNLPNLPNLPPCPLCGATPYGPTKINGHVICPSSRVRCGLSGVPLSEDEWRRLHGPRQAPEYLEALHAIADRIEWHGLVQTAAELRAALAVAIDADHDNP